MQNLAELMIDWAKEAGKIMISFRSSSLKVSNKSKREQVTEADLAVDKFLKEQINTFYPDHKILSEELSPEQSEDLATGPLWVIDPIDGTHNYARGHYQCAVSIAYCEDSISKAGVVYNPFCDELFHAEAGKGAFLNGNKIHCSDISELDQALVGVGRPYHLQDTDFFVRQLSLLLKNTFGVRRMGSGALDLCWTACGRLDGFFETLNPWDIAAAICICKEAGCKIGHFQDSRDSVLKGDLDAESLIVSGPLLYDSLKEMIQNA